MFLNLIFDILKFDILKFHVERRMQNCFVLNQFCYIKGVDQYNYCSYDMPYDINDMI